MALLTGPTRRLIRWPTNNVELWLLIRELWGVEIPNTKICDDHCTPLEAVADAFFARFPLVLWKASRGLAGKTFDLATLSLTEAVVYNRCRIALLGGSLYQSGLAYAYTGELWDFETGPDEYPPRRAPRELLKGDPTAKATELTNGSKITVLPASTKSVRGPHPQRLRMDEADEMQQFVLESALGQPMERFGVEQQTVISSTHHYADGTWAWVAKQAREKGWPTYEWCYRESNARGTGWLSDKQIEVTRGATTSNAWRVEYELGEPSIEGRAIDTDSVEAAFREDLGHVPGDVAVEYEFEAPEPGVPYATSADWAKTEDWTVIVTFRMDTRPWRCVAWQRINRRPYPQMVKIFNDRILRYPPGQPKRRSGARQAPPATIRHDATGLGTVVADLLDLPVPDHDDLHVTMAGASRQAQFNEYIAAIEAQHKGEPAPELVYPLIDWAKDQHLFCTVEDLTKSSGHPPDSFVAGSLAWLCRPVGAAPSPLASPRGPTRAPGTGWRDR